jgi:hypothetical protein
MQNAESSSGHPLHVEYPQNNYTYLVQPSAYAPDLETEEQRTQKV